MQKISPCLWFDDQAEEAVDFYASVFANSKITSVSRYGKESAQVAGKPERSVMVMEFELEGQRFMALNGGPQFTFTPAISLMVNCDTQAEVDELWDRLSAGGSEQQCGWLADGQVRGVMADRPHPARRVDGGRRLREIQEGHASAAANAQDRSSRAATGLRRGLNG
jgi:predicted 3-demethylubiquinone-9 3-methyltransferase (glyoxalase superfamily)